MLLVMSRETESLKELICGAVVRKSALHEGDRSSNPSGSSYPN